VVRPFHTAWAETASFYAHHRPSAHFRTSSRSSSQVARALARIIVQQWERLRAPRDFTVTDVGADDGHLLDAVRSCIAPEFRKVMHWRAVDIAEGTGDFEWIAADITTADLPARPGVLYAQELLDDIPCTVVENDDEGFPWVVGIDDSGVLTTITPLDDVAELTWLDTWWPDGTPLAYREVGSSRDAAWMRLRSSVTAGAAIAIDYGHVCDERRRGRWAGGTVRAFQAGRVVRPIPDGHRNITAHVSMDSLGPGRLHRQAETTGIGGSEGELFWLIEERGSPCAT